MNEVGVGCSGRISDGGVFRNATLSNALEENTLNILNARSLPGGQERLSFVIVGDAAFPLKEYLIKPYPHRQLPGNNGYVTIGYREPDVS